MANPCKVYQYAVKFVGGLARPVDQQGQSVVAPGWYFTAINIFNPGRCKAVPFRWRAVAANGFDQRAGAISVPRAVTLRPGAGVEIDTHHVIGKNPARLRKGFVVIESPCELDVVAVYSASPPTANTPIGGLVAFHTERVPARLVDTCRDLALDLSTGVHPWTIIRALNTGGMPLPGVTTPRAAVPITPSQPATWLNQPGAPWIGLYSAPSAPSGRYSFRACFSLCAGFGITTLDLSTRTDNAAQIAFNGTVVQTTPNTSYSGPQSQIQLTTGFLPGMNCLEITTRNDAPQPTPMGVSMRALLRSEHGACDCDCGCSGCDDEPPVPRLDIEGPGPEEARPALDDDAAAADAGPANETIHG